MVWNGSCESCAENNIRSTPVELEEAIEKLTPEGEGVAPNGWGDPASTGNGAAPGSLAETGSSIVFSPCGYFVRLKSEGSPRLPVSRNSPKNNPNIKCASKNALFI